MKLKLTTLILLIAIFCFGCGKNEHETEMEIDDKYGYAGTWIGQSPNFSFMIFNITRESKSESPYSYLLVNLVYFLEIKGTPNEQLVTASWEMATDFRGAVVLDNQDDLILDNGLTLGDGVSDTSMLWRQMRHDGNNLVFVSDTNKDFKFSREDDYDDLLDEIADLKKRIFSDFKKEMNRRFPNARVNIIDNAKPPNKLLK